MGQTSADKCGEVLRDLGLVEFVTPGVYRRLRESRVWSAWKCSVRGRNAMDAEDPIHNGLIVAGLSSQEVPRVGLAPAS